MTTSGLRLKSSSKFKVDSWVGDVSAFSKVIEVCRQLQDEAIRLAQAKTRAEHERGKSAWLAEYAFVRDEGEREAKWEARLSEELDSIARALRLSMVSRHRRFDQELRGEPAEVLEALDLDDLSAVSLGLGSIYSTYGNGGFGLLVRFTQADGCEVQVVGPDNDWIVLANEKLRTQLRGRRPWYSFIRHPFVLIPLLLVPVLTISWGIVTWVSDAVGTEVAASFALLFLAVIVPGATWGLSYGIRRLLPAFELLPLGVQAKGNRVLSLVFAAIAWVGGIVIPLLLSQVDGSA
jgi:hypothetical protein